VQADVAVAGQRLRETLGQRGLAWADDFVSAEGCGAFLEELAFAFWQPSSVVSRMLDGSLLNHRSPTRVSETTTQEWFTSALKSKIRSLERRLTRLLDRPIDQYEPWQAVRYRRGGHFDFHNDAGYWACDLAGERELTVMLYLNAPDQGGGTRFRDLGIEVAARPGRLVVWNNLLVDGTCNPRMIHAGTPVRKGRKCILVTWIRQQQVRDQPRGLPAERTSR